MTDETETPITFSDLPKSLQRRIFLSRLAQQRQEIDQITSQINSQIERMNLAIAREQQKVDFAEEVGSSQRIIDTYRGYVTREQDRFNVGITQMVKAMNDHYQLQRTLFKAGR